MNSIDYKKEKFEVSGISDPFLILSNLIDHQNSDYNQKQIDVNKILDSFWSIYNKAIKYVVYHVLCKIKSKVNEWRKDIVKSLSNYKKQVDFENSRVFHDDHISQEKTIIVKRKKDEKSVKYNPYEAHTVKYGDYKRCVLYDPEEFKIKVEGEEMKRIILSLEHEIFFRKQEEFN